MLSPRNVVLSFLGQVPMKQLAPKNPKTDTKTIMEEKKNLENERREQEKQYRDKKRELSEKERNLRKSQLDVPRDTLIVPPEFVKMVMKKYLNNRHITRLKEMLNNEIPIKRFPL